MGESTAEEERDSEDSGSTKPADKVPFNFRYIAVCLLWPYTVGTCYGYPWSSAAIYVTANGWPLWKLGLCTSLGTVLRMCVGPMYLATGIWVHLPFAVVHLACVILAFIWYLGSVYFCLKP